MNHELIYNALEQNAATFQALFSGVSPEEYRWRPQPDKWSLIEVLCHLHDEEREDFRARLKHTLQTPEERLPRINPVGWVTERDYAHQDYETMLKKFVEERVASVQWLRSIENPDWRATHFHPKWGAFSAQMFLENWLAHDLLHFRQIASLKYYYLAAHAGDRMDYAGTW